MDIPRRSVLGAVGASLVIAGCTADSPEENGADEIDIAPGDDTDQEYDISVLDHDEYGEMLVGPAEVPLYMYDSDVRDAGESSCFEECEQQWPAYVTPDLPMADEAIEAEIDTFERAQDILQVSINGWPVYFHADDEEGEPTGQGEEGGAWWLVDPSGEPLREDD